MDTPRMIIRALVLAFSVALVACSSDDSAGTTSTTTGTTSTISGLAEAPNGTIAQLENNQSVLVAATNFMFPAAYAAITGLQPVTGATVNLIRIDDDGNQLGAVLASTVTSITGNYSLALPTGVSLAGDLVVRITGNGGASMSAMVVDQAVDINPISQFVLKKFVDDDALVLADLAINEVVSLQGKVEEFDLTATADLSTMLTQLEAEVGQFVDDAIAIIESTPDDGTAATAVAGNWHTIEFDPSMHDSDPDTSGILSGTFGLEVLSEEIAITDGGIGTLSFTLGAALIDTFTNYNVDFTGTTSIFHEVSLGDPGDTFAGTIDADGNINISFPFEEELQTVDVIGGTNDPDSDGPDFGWRYPPGNIALYPVTSNPLTNDTYVSITTEAGVRYETTDTDGDGINDAVDPNARAGDEVFMNMLLVLKEGSGMTASSLNGDYGMVALTITLDTAPVAVFDSTVGIVNFNSGTATIAVDALDVQEVTRTPATPPAVALTPDTFTEPAAIDGAETFPYTVEANGQVTLDFAGDGSDVLEGYANSSASLVAFVDDISTGSPVTNVDNEIVMAVKLGSSMQTTLNGATYRLHPLVIAMGESGYSEIFTLGNGTVVFNADASSAVVDGVDRGFERGNDVAEIEAIIPDDPATSAQTYTASISGNGQVTMSSTEGTFTTTLKGFVSEDTNMLIMRIYGDDTAGDKDLGIVIGIKQ